jgi:DNA-binding response OmpR family regulator
MKKILIVEDDPFLMEIYTEKLKKEGFLIEGISDSENFFEKLKEDHFDLILLDLVLPKMNGFEILEQLKKNFPEQKVVVISNLGSKRDIERCLELGAKDFIVKAKFSLQDFVKKIKEIVEQ